MQGVIADIILLLVQRARDLVKTAFHDIVTSLEAPLEECLALANASIPVRRWWTQHSCI